MEGYLKMLVAILLFVSLGLGVFAVYHNYFLPQLRGEIIKVASAPKDITDPFHLGQFFFNTGDQADGTYDLNQARINYQRSVELDPQKELLAWHQLGRIDFLEGKFNDAIYNFNQQIEYFGDELPNVYYMLGLTYGYLARENGSATAWDNAESNFLKYLEYDPTSPWARVDLSWIYFAQGKYAEMLPLLEVGLIYEPANPWLLNMFGLALMNTGDQEKAHQYFSWAKEEAAQLTAEDWGKYYPGNHPDSWAQGLKEFQAVIEKNLELTSPN